MGLDVGDPVEDLLIMPRDGSGRPPEEDKAEGWKRAWDKARILALDKGTGELRWEGKRGMSRISHVVPGIWRAPDGHVELVSPAGDVVQGFDARTGERLWSSTNIGEGVVPAAVIGRGMVFSSPGWGGRVSIKAFRLGERGELGETNLVWERKEGVSKVPSYLFVDPYLYTLEENGRVMCLMAETGEIVWDERINANFGASPVAAAGHIYYVDDAGATTVIEEGPEYKLVAHNELDGVRVQSSPAVTEGQILIRTETHLYAIEDRAGGGEVSPVATGAEGPANVDRSSSMAAGAL